MGDKTVPAQLTRQEQLFGERERDHGTLTIKNGTIYPFIRAVNALVDEAKVRFDDDGIHVTSVDPANVGMIDITLGVDHGIAETVVGPRIDSLAGILQNKPRDVTVDINFAAPYGTVTIEREYANGRVWNVMERFGMLDPDSIRESKDIPDVEYDAEATVDVNRLSSFLARWSNTSNPIKIGAADGQFQIGEHAGDHYDAVATADIPVDSDATAIYSVEYFIDMVRGIKATGAGEVTLQWSEEFPLHMDARADDIRTTYVLAPRIKSE